MLDNDEIVAAMIGTWTTTNREAIVAAAKTGNVTRYLTRKEAKFMAALDLDINWQRLAEAPTIIWIVNGKPTLANPNKIQDPEV